MRSPAKPAKRGNGASLGLVAEQSRVGHRLPGHLLTRAVRVLVVGCGGNGSEVLSGLPFLHQAMLAFGHPHGLDVLVMDGDVVSPTNIVRQAFMRSDVGHMKAPILVNRLNAFWGLNWRAVPRHLEPLREAPKVRESVLGARSAQHRQGLGADIVIGCVDSRAARRIIRDRIMSDRSVSYWLDLGNEAAHGQFVLGGPFFEVLDQRGFVRGAGVKTRPMALSPNSPERLPSVADLYPETIDAAGDKSDTLPSCSAQEALQRQEPFVNRTLAAHGLALLARLFRYGELHHHGGFVNLATGRMVPIPVSPEHWARTMASNAPAVPTSARRKKSA